MRRLALVLIPLICLASSSAFAVTITVHSSPSFTVDAVNVYATAYQYPSQADAIAAANSFLADGAADSGWGTGVFGGDGGYQAQYLYFAYASGSGYDRAVLLASTGNQATGDRSGVLQATAANWTYDNDVNDQRLLLASAYTPLVVPEPRGAFLMGLGLAGLASVRRR
ncbi:MAG: PEP-CTERM sorting domain-containing protein [Myxococcota bacterium]